MQSKLIRLLLLALLLPLQGAAQTFVNLTPRPKTMTVASGSVALPTDFKISSVGLDDEMKAEINRFAADFIAATGLDEVAAKGIYAAAKAVAELTSQNKE